MEFKPVKEEKYLISGINVHTYSFPHLPNRPYAIALHGLRNDTRKNYPLINLLEEHFNVIAFDFPGHGLTKEYTMDSDYLDFSAGILEGLIEKLRIDHTNTVLLGGSFGANVIIKYLAKNPDLEFKKVGLLAPFFSPKYMTMNPKFKNRVLKLAAMLAKNGWFTKVFQLFVNLKIPVAILAILIYRSLDLKFIAHEVRLWNICSLQIWGKSIMDQLNTDNSEMPVLKNSKHITFVYPEYDQYIDVDGSTNEFKQKFPEAIFKKYKAKFHMPRGDWSKDQEFMSIMKSLLETSLLD